MMRSRYAGIVVAAALLLVAGQAPAAESAGQASRGLKIGYVDLDRVAEQSAMVRERVRQVEENLRAKQKGYKDTAEKLRRLRRELVTQESILTAAQVAQKKAEIQRLRDELDFLQYQANKTLSDTSRNVIEPVLDQVLMAVEKVATKYKIDIVLRGDLVLFASERVDLTKHVIYELDSTMKKNPGGSPAKAPARRSEKPASTKRLEKSTTVKPK